MRVREKPLRADAWQFNGHFRCALDIAQCLGDAFAVAFDDHNHDIVHITYGGKRSKADPLGQKPHTITVPKGSWVIRDDAREVEVILDTQYHAQWEPEESE